MYSKPVPFLVNEYDFRICHMKECRLPQWFFKPHKISWCAQHPILVFLSFIILFFAQTLVIIMFELIAVLNSEMAGYSIS